MARNAMHDAVQADPRTRAYVPINRTDRCRQRVAEHLTCGRLGTWLIDDGERALLRCTQHAHAWLTLHPLEEP